MPKFLHLKPQASLKKFALIIKTAEIKILRLAIRHLRNEIFQLEQKVYYLHQELTLDVTSFILDAFLQKVHNTLEFDTNIIIARHKKKLTNLTNSAKKDKLVITDKENVHDLTVRENINNFVNLSTHQCTKHEIRVLNLSPKFAFKTPLKLEKTIPCVEEVIQNIPDELQDRVRNQFVFALKKEHSFHASNNPNNQDIKILKNLHKNHNIRIVKADKSEQLVLLDKDYFQKKIEETLADLNASPLTKDPTATICTKIQKLLARKDLCIPEKLNATLYPAPPSLFVKIKLHKPNHPFRPIVSKCHSPTYMLEKYLAKFLKPLIAGHPFNIESGKELLSKIKCLKLETTSKLYSLDVVALFPSVPVDMVHKLILQKCNDDHVLKQFSPFLDIALKIIFNNNYFKINGLLFKQNSGTPMGSPLSTICAETIMQLIENTILPTTQLKPQIYLRYVDDVFLIWPFRQSSLNELVEKLNNVTPSIKFTMEKEKDRCLPFLDLSIHRSDNLTLWFDVYKKPTTVLAPIPFNSNHPLSSKKAFFQTHSVRNRLYTTFKFHEDYNFKNLLNIGVKERYPTSLVKNWICKAERIEGSEYTQCTRPTLKFTPAIPYSEFFVHIVKQLKKKHCINIPFEAPMTISNLVLSDRDETLSCGGIYSIPITLEDKIFKYIGKTTRNVNIRLNEHKKSLRVNYGNTALKQFLFDNLNAVPNWNNTKVIAAPKNRQQLDWQEAVCIATNENTVNSEPGRILAKVWQPILEIIQNKRGRSESGF